MSSLIARGLLACAVVLVASRLFILLERRRRLAHCLSATNGIARRYGAPGSRPLALVTGASSGIGEAISRKLFAAGFDLVLVARRKDRLDALAESLMTSAPGSHVHCLSCDFSAVGASQRLMEDLRTLGLKVDVGVLNAGAGYVGAFSEQDPKRLSELVQLNSVAVMETAHALSRSLRERRRPGALILMSSLSALQPLPYHAVYAASKAFTSFLGAALHDELAPHGIDVVTIEPGTTATEFQLTSGSAPHAGLSPDAVAQGALEALALRQCVWSPPGWAYWKSCIASILPRSFVLPLARKRMQKLLRTEAPAH